MAITVSILDDHFLIRDGVSRALTEAGMQVLACHEEPSTFFEHLRQEPPTVAIVDLALRHNSEGLVVLERAQQLHPQVRYLVLSGSLEPDVVARCFRAGASGYLHKLNAGFDSVVAAVNALANGTEVRPLVVDASLFQPSAQAQAESALLQELSPREREVLSYVTAGADNLKIATLLGIAERTVKAHVSSLYRKLGQENRTQLALIARELGVRPAMNV